MNNIITTWPNEQQQGKYAIVIYKQISDEGGMSEVRITGVLYELNEDTMLCIHGESIYEIPMNSMVYCKRFSDSEQMKKYQKELDFLQQTVNNATKHWYLALESTSPQEWIKKLADKLYSTKY